MVFGILGSAFVGNTSRYSQDARQYKPDWQRAYESAGASANSSLNRQGRAGKAASDLLAANQPVTFTDPVTLKQISLPSAGLRNAANILAQTSSKILIAAKQGEQLAIQARIDRLGDPIKKLQRKNPLYRDEPPPPIPKLRSRARDFLRRLRQFQGVDGKEISLPFPSASARVREDQVFAPEILGLTRNYGLTQNFLQRVSINKQESFILDTLRELPSSEPPTHVAVKLHGGASERGYTIQKQPIGQLQIYDANSDTVIRTLDSSNVEILTFAEFQQLRYISSSEEVTNRLDYIEFVALKDGNGDGDFDDASDERGSHEQIAVAINGGAVNRQYRGADGDDHWEWRGRYLNEQKSRFATAEVTLEGTFVGADALTDYRNGDLEIKVVEAGQDNNRAVLDESRSSGNRLVFRFDHAYDGIDLRIEYADNEVVNSGVEKVTVSLN